MFDTFQKQLYSYVRYQLLDRLPVSIYHLPSSTWAFMLSSLFRGHLLEKQDKTNASPLIMIILPDIRMAKKLYEETQTFVSSEYLYFLPELDGIPYEWTVHDLLVCGQRIRTFSAISENQKGIIFTTARAIATKVPPSFLWKQRKIQLTTKQNISFHHFLHTLIEYGYKRVDKVENIGEFSLKGEILDIYPVHLEFPVRIDLFDVEIESIRYFHPDTQKSIEEISTTFILPVSEITLNQKEFKELKYKILQLPKTLRKPEWISDKKFTNGSIINGRELAGISQLIGFQYNMETIWDYFSQPPLTIIALEDQIDHQLAILHKEYNTLYKNYKNQKIALPPETLLYLDWKNHLKKIPHFTIHHLHNLKHKNNQNSISQNQLKDTPKFKGKVTEFRNYIRNLLEKSSTIIISSHYKEQMQRIASFLKNEQIPFQSDTNTNIQNQIYLMESNLSQGFIYEKENFYFFTDSDIFGKIYSKRIKYKSQYVSPLESFLDLKEGDYVVHINHGIGKFLRLERISAAGKQRDCLVIEYANKDILYVPLDQISLVQRYISPEKNPRLDHLGKASFKKIRKKVEENIQEFAKELMELYAARMELKGFAFPPDTHWQEEFESKFPFEETPDQIRAIEEVKRDMESERPMDRLICGDVGYGKTEVAIRAAFKCVMAGKQTAIICPTTILAKQHLITFRKRLQEYPIQIDWITSLRSTKEIREIKKKLRDGKIDIIIGTHALLSRDVHIPNLGLLIIDEEQRFGVAHKEKLKKIKKTVDVLTLTATPIPRTLHMSLIGIRDLSIINTPPKERKPVETYVLEDSDQTLKEAILKEIERGGQVFYLHNRIQTLDIVAEKIRSLIPDIRIAILHSKLHDKDIDIIMNDFLEQKYDLLLTTTIIENGIDIPNVNTLIVDEADKFGLSQLYQLRGRVGRSSRQAYAYFFHKGTKIITEEAQKRLNTLLEYQELGSGFKIAMRDLEIRGAGNILGKEQSGDIIEIGYELYLKLLEKAIKKLKGEKIEPEIRCHISFPFDFFISETYIQDTKQRIEFYKKFEATKTPEEYQEVLQELWDRFGKPDKTSEIFILLEHIRVLGTRLGIESISANKEGEIQIRPSSHFKVPIDIMLSFIKNENNFYLKPGNTTYIFLDSISLQHLKNNKKLSYTDFSISITIEDLKNIIHHLQRLLTTIENKKTSSLNQKSNQKEQKTIA